MLCQNCIFHQIFKLMVFRFDEIHLQVKILNLFLLMLPGHPHPLQFLIITPQREKSPIPPDSKIYSVPAEMGGRENCMMKPSNDNNKEEDKFPIIHDLLLSFWIQKASFIGVLLQELNLGTVVLCRSCCIYGPSQISVWLGLVYLQY